MKTKIQSSKEFEELISPHIVQRGLTVEGLKIAQDWLCERTGDNRPRRVKRLETLRGFAYNMR